MAVADRYFNVTDLDLRAKLQWANGDLEAHLKYFNGISLYQPIQPKLCKRLMIGARELMVLFREFGKSTLAEELAVNELAYKDKAFVLYFSSSDEAAIDHIQAIKNAFERDTLPTGQPNPFKILVPSRTTKGYRWKDGDFILANGNRCTGGGVGKFVLGKKQLAVRPTLIIVDDPVPKEKGDDKRIIHWFRQTILPMGSPMTRIIIIGTPRRYQDIIMEYLNDEDKSFNIHFYPAVYEDGTVSCPDFWTREGACCIESRIDPESIYKCGYLSGDELVKVHIEQKKREVKSIAWSTEYLLKPTDDGSSLFPMAMLRKPAILNKNLTFEINRQIQRMSLEEMHKSGIIPRRIPCVIGCDHAISESSEADFSVFTVMSAEYNQPRRLLDRFKGRGISFAQQKTILQDLNTLWKPQLILSESNGFQIIFSQDLRAHSNLPILPYNTGGEKNAYELGIPSMKVNFENNSYEIPYGKGEPEEENETRDFVDTLYRQLNGFIYEEGTVVSVTKYDDCGMSFWLADTAAREYVENTTVMYRGTRMS